MLHIVQTAVVVDEHLLKAAFIALKFAVHTPS
jgi:hypothetical protein